MLLHKIVVQSREVLPIVKLRVEYQMHLVLQFEKRGELFVQNQILIY